MYYSWEFFSTFGYSWVLLDTFGCLWVLVGIFGYFWVLLTTDRYFGVLWGTFGTFGTFIYFLVLFGTFFVGTFGLSEDSKRGLLEACLGRPMGRPWGVFGASLRRPCGILDFGNTTLGLELDKLG